MSAGNGFSKSIKPVTAMIAGARMLVDLEDTKQAFIIFDAIDGPQTEKNFQKYLSTKSGMRMNAELVDFQHILQSLSYHSHYSPGSLADSYLNFMDSEFLDADTLVEAEKEAGISTLNLDAERRAFVTAGFAQHDLLHVITGYGRDPIGEACLLAFTATQLDLKGVGTFAFSLILREKFKNPQLPVFEIHKEACDRAKQASWLPAVDWRIYLDRSLENARRENSISPPRKYNRSVQRLETTNANDESTITKKVA